MNKFSFFAILVCSLFVTTANSQINIAIADPSGTGGNYGNINVIDPATIGNKKIELINFSDIQGNPFYIQKWSKAFLYFKNGNMAKVDQAKLNMYSNEVDFINVNKVEMVLEASNFKRIILMKQEDTSHIASIFECYPALVDESNAETFYRVLNSGSVQLYVLEKSVLKTGEYDPMQGKAPKTFITKKSYALSNAGVFSQIKNLDRTSILALLNAHQNEEDWLNTNHNKLHNEKEVIAFFEFLNSSKK